MNCNPLVDQTINYTIGFKFEWFGTRMRFDNKRKSIGWNAICADAQNKISEILISNI